jgi:hypothetical protein
MKAGGTLIIYSIIHREKERERRDDESKSIKEDEYYHNVSFLFSMRIISKYLSST